MLKFHPEGAKIILIATLFTVLGIFGVDHLLHDSNIIICKILQVLLLGFLIFNTSIF